MTSADGRKRMQAAVVVYEILMLSALPQQYLMRLAFCHTCYMYVASIVKRVLLLSHQMHCC
jgi:hypothetical protein